MKIRICLRSAPWRAAIQSVVVAAAMLNFGPLAQGQSYTSIQTLGQGGVFPVNGLAGDAFGQVVAVNKDYLFVSSPGSQPNNKSIAGAVFVYRWNGSQYENTQVITTAGTGDHLAILQVSSDRDWLVLGATGTPLGPQPNDEVLDQDFQGAALVFRLGDNGQWELKQVIDSNTPGLEDLSVIGGGGIPVLLTPQGANLGLRTSLDAERGWLFVSALYQDGTDGLDPIMNAGKVFAFRLDRSTGVWTLAQTFTNPDGDSVNDAFGAAVAVKGRYVMIGNGSVFQGPHLGNAAVYVYRLDGASWSYVQRLSGVQNTVTPLTFPQFDPNTVGVGDAFGNAIALSQDHALITAPLESRSVPNSIYNGAAYFFRREQTQEGERWILRQRVESDDPNSFAFGVFNVALSGSTALIGDLARTGPSAVQQGAAHVYKLAAGWQKSTTLSDLQGAPGDGFGAGVALGTDGRLVVGSSPFLGFFIPVIFRPPPVSAPPVAAGKVIVFAPSGS